MKDKVQGIDKGKKNKEELEGTLDETFSVLDRVREEHKTDLVPDEVGSVWFVGRGIVGVKGLPGVKSEELVRFPGNRLGIVFNLDKDDVSVVLLDETENIKAGGDVFRTGRVMDVPVGEGLLGRVVDATGRPLDDEGPIQASERRSVEQKAPAVMDRAPVNLPLQTGIKAVDALIPIGRGQRELILGDRQTGKSALAVDTMINQRDKDVLCVYCAIGQRNSAVAQVIADLRQYEMIANCIVVVGGAEDPAGLKFITPYAATTMAEYFMEQGRDILIVYDDLTRHARAYRELSLLLRRPPAREAYPGDIFYIHSRLLERATHLREELGGGSLTALPIVETEAQNISAYIPTNLVSITDGQIYLSPELFQQGVLPAVDVGKSVSRVGGKTQFPAYRAVVSDLRLSYSQFEELEVFARFGTQLDEETNKTLQRGRRVREVLKQAQYEPMSMSQQIAILIALAEGVFDDLKLEHVKQGQALVAQSTAERLPDICKGIEAGGDLSDGDRQAIVKAASEAVEKIKEKNADTRIPEEENR